jgi:hypothetical protein
LRDLLFPGFFYLLKLKIDSDRKNTERDPRHQRQQSTEKVSENIFHFLINLFQFGFFLIRLKDTHFKMLKIEIDFPYKNWTGFIHSSAQTIYLYLVPPFPRLSKLLKANQKYFSQSIKSKLHCCKVLCGCIAKTIFFQTISRMVKIYHLSVSQL